MFSELHAEIEVPLHIPDPGTFLATSGNELCEFHTTFQRSAHTFFLTFTDKIINNVQTVNDCQQFCQEENEFICRSFNWIAPRGVCQLYHNTRRTVPEYSRTVPSLNRQVEYREIVCLESEFFSFYIVPSLTLIIKLDICFELVSKWLINFIPLSDIRTYTQSEPQGIIFCRS